MATPTLAQDITTAQQLRAQLAAIERRVEDRTRNRPSTPQDFADLADIQVRADAAYKAVGWNAPPAHPGETRAEFRRRLIDNLKQKTPTFKDFDFTDIPAQVLNVLEPQVYADAAKEARHPTMLAPGELRAVTFKDQSGRDTTEYFGAPSGWLNDFKPDRIRAVLNEGMIRR